MEGDDSEAEIKSVSQKDFNLIDKELPLRRAIFANRGFKFKKFTDEQLVFLTDPKFVQILYGQPISQKVTYFKKHHGFYKGDKSSNHA